MPSMESWPAMGSATAHLTGATLAPGGPSVRFKRTEEALERSLAEGSSNISPCGGRLGYS